MFADEMGFWTRGLTKAFLNLLPEQQIDGIFYPCPGFSLIIIIFYILRIGGEKISFKRTNLLLTSFGYFGHPDNYRLT
jgi:hypothetical protein